MGGSTPPPMTPCSNHMPGSHPAHSLLIRRQASAETGMLKSSAATQPRHGLKPGARGFYCLNTAQHCPGMYTAMADWPLTGVDEMSEQIDWSKAPEEATHAAIRHDGRFVAWICAADMDIENGLVARPATPSWSGEGLPPVGVVCEYNAMPEGRPKKWHKVEVVYASDWVIVLRCIEAPNGHEGGNGVEIAMAVDNCSMKDIRPIRTPEQVAAEERDAALSSMMYSISFSNDREAKRICAELYDAGYRKEKSNE